MLIDTHCHLTHPRLTDDLDAVLARARDAGLGACVTIGTGVEDAVAGCAIAERHGAFVQRSAGIDPFTAHRLGVGFESELARLEPLLEGCVAVGEIGLDYHYELDTPERQAEVLELQLELAERRDLPVVIHVREAHDDMATVLARHPGNRGVIHSFTAGPYEAERYLELGWYLAYNGVLTFKSAPEVREAATLTPRDRLLVETDSPYLAPVPYRGKRCEPAHVATTLAYLADLLECESAELAQTTTSNACALFALPTGEGVR